MSIRRGSGLGQVCMGTLFVVGTPIGNLSDLSDRARQVLVQCPVIVAEDTRRTGQLLASIGGSARLISLTEHNLSRRVEPILRALDEGDVALVSDAGTPAISDPGQQLIEAAHGAGHVVRPIPGPSAVVAALSVSGLPATPFTFAGYAPRGAGELARWIDGWLRGGETVVFFEAPGRIERAVLAIRDADPGCTVVICREMTKIFEQVVRGTAENIAARLADGSIPARGEFVVVARGTGRDTGVDVDQLLTERLEAGEGPNQAAKSVAAETGQAKSDLYKRALELKQTQSG
jgi:16S rRNA (cytidine1402-2'-O)-methyltransferase